MLGNIAIGEMYIRERHLGLLIDTPSNNAHLGNISKSLALPFDGMFLVRPMNEIMTRLTKRDEVVRAISARLARFDMMRIQNAVFRFSLAPLTGMVISEEHIFTHIPEAKLRSLLILDAINVRILNLLKIELRYLNGSSADRQ